MSKENEAPVELLDGTYFIGKSIGKGSFGNVFAAHHIKTGEAIAVKFEKTDNHHLQLYNEYRIYQEFYHKGCTGVPRPIAYGEKEGYNYMVLQLLGPSLESLFNHCKRQFSLKTVLMIGLEMLNRVQQLHDRGYIHRDIKPDNFVIGSNDKSHPIYLIDLGLAQRYYTIINHKQVHVPIQKNQSFTGTARYASIRSQQKFSSSRRDDIESIAYILIYFLRGRLPWQQAKRDVPPQQRKAEILKIKESTRITELCKGVPPELAMFLKYARDIEFEQGPNYTYLRRLLVNCFRKERLENDKKYDWMT